MRPVRCEFRPRNNGRGYVLMIEVRSAADPSRASQTIIDPGKFLSAREVEKEACKQAVRLCEHIYHTVPDTVIDPDAIVRLVPGALADAALEIHKAELRRGS